MGVRFDSWGSRSRASREPGLPNLDPEGRFSAEMCLKCRMAAIETEANAKIRKSLVGRSRPMRGNHVHGDLVSRDWCASSTRSLAGTSSGHRNRWRKCLGVTSCDSCQMCKGAAAYGITRRARDARDAVMRIGGDSKHGRT